MSFRRLVSILSVSTLALGIASAAPKKGGKPVPAKTPAAGSAAKGSAAGSGGGAGGSASGSASGGGGATGSAAGSAVQMTEDAPPSDMNGTDENPDAPHAKTIEEHVVAGPVAPKPTGYPLEEALRPITLPQNMSEIAIGPHAQISPFASADALRARYGITSQVQLGLTYLLGGIYDQSQADPGLPSKQGFHPGKAIGLDVTVLLQNWIGVRVGVPVYISPVALALTVGAPIKFTFGDKFAIGGFDDLLSFRLDKFVPSFYQEVDNAAAAHNFMTNTNQSRGHLRFSAYGIMQTQKNVALIGRFGIDNSAFLGSGGGSGAGAGAGNTTSTFIRLGVEYSPRKYLDLGASLGFDDLVHGGSIGPAGYLALRI